MASRGPLAAAANANTAKTTTVNGLQQKRFVSKGEVLIPLINELTN